MADPRHPNFTPLPSVTVPRERRNTPPSNTPRYDIGVLGMLVSVIKRIQFYVDIPMEEFLEDNRNGVMRRDATAYCTITLAETLKHLRLSNDLDRKLRVTWWLRIRATLAHYYEVIDWELLYGGHFDNNLAQVADEIDRLYNEQNDLLRDKEWPTLGKPYVFFS
jgi:uncharacterized protein with HEPN domain